LLLLISLALLRIWMSQTTREIVQCAVIAQKLAKNPDTDKCMAKKLDFSRTRRGSQIELGRATAP
jgi:hypothetical protein